MASVASYNNVIDELKCKFNYVERGQKGEYPMLLLVWVEAEFASYNRQEMLLTYPHLDFESSQDWIEYSDPHENANPSKRWLDMED